ncbi:MAG: monofunctional biosynthetic peptidoglycan transglycosylase [Acidobacteria bacterium]|nr:monofunctional biosynthetic peptidoglycan transglycosylase [Acidobacteriota bacterium]
MMPSLLPSIAHRLRAVLMLLLIAAGGWLLVEVMLWPDVAALAESNVDRTAFMERYRARHGRPVALTWIAYGDIADTLKRAVLVAEDIDFFGHDGFALGEIRQALSEAIREGKLPRGASTISQQLAKNLWLSPSRTPRRKLREVLLTRALERRLEKKRILEIYLNVVDFGDGTFGCEAASRRFFGKPASRLSTNEAARLAAVLPRPSRWSPEGSDAAFLGAVRRIERRMQRARWLRREI